MLALIIIALFVLGFFLMSLSSGRLSFRQLFGTIDGEDLLRKDERRPVLYLRPFDFDEWSSRPRSVEVDGVPGFFSLRTLPAPSYEAALAKVVIRVGPRITVSNPKSNRRVKGFSTIRLGPHEWQQKVETQMKKAALVILCAGSDEGITWEFVKACDVVPRQRLVILTINSTSEEWWQMAERTLQTRLPRVGSYEPDLMYGMLYFDKDGNAHSDVIVPVQGNLTKAMTAAFRPVFKQLQELDNHFPPLA